MTPRDEGDMRVADYVLGLMEPNERAFFEREMREDRALAAEVAEWRARIARVDATPPPRPVNPDSAANAFPKPTPDDDPPTLSGGRTRVEGSLLRPLGVGIVAALALCAVVAWMTI